MECPRGGSAHAVQVGPSTTGAKTAREETGTTCLKSQQGLLLAIQGYQDLFPSPQRKSFEKPPPTASMVALDVSLWPQHLQTWALAGDLR